MSGATDAKQAAVRWQSKCPVSADK
jgi:hypothetical protein